MINFDKLYQKNPHKFAGKIVRVLEMLSRFGMSRLVKRENCRYYTWMERIVRPWVEIRGTAFVEPVQMSDPRMFDYCHAGTVAYDVMGRIFGFSPFRERLAVIRMDTDERVTQNPFAAAAGVSSADRFRDSVREFMDSPTKDIALLAFRGHQRVLFKEAGRYHIIDPHGRQRRKSKDVSMLASAGLPVETLVYHQRAREQYGPNCVSVSIARVIYMIIRKYSSERVYNPENESETLDPVDYLVSIHEPVPCAFAYFTAQLVQFESLPGAITRRTMPLASTERQQASLREGTVARKIRYYFEDVMGVHVIDDIEVYMQKVGVTIPAELAEHFFSEDGLMSLSDDDFIRTVREFQRIMETLRAYFADPQMAGDSYAPLEADVLKTESRQFLSIPAIIGRVQRIVSDNIEMYMQKVGVTIPAELAQHFFSEDGLMSLSDDDFIRTLREFQRIIGTQYLYLKDLKKAGDSYSPLEADVLKNEARQFMLRHAIIGRIRRIADATIEPAKERVRDTSARLDPLDRTTFTNLIVEVKRFINVCIPIAGFTSFLGREQHAALAGYNAYEMIEQSNRVLDIVCMWFPRFSEDPDVFYENRFAAEIGTTRLPQGDGHFPMTPVDINWAELDAAAPYMDVENLQRVFMSPANLLRWYFLVAKQWKPEKIRKSIRNQWNQLILKFRETIETRHYTHILSDIFDIIDKPRHRTQEELEHAERNFPRYMIQVTEYWRD